MRGHYLFQEVISFVSVAQRKLWALINKYWPRTTVWAHIPWWQRQWKLSSCIIQWSCFQQRYMYISLIPYIGHCWEFSFWQVWLIAQISGWWVRQGWFVYWTSQEGGVSWWTEPLVADQEWDWPPWCTGMENKYSVCMRSGNLKKVLEFCLAYFKDNKRVEVTTP